MGSERVENGEISAWSPVTLNLMLSLDKPRQRRRAAQLSSLLQRTPPLHPPADAKTSPRTTDPLVRTARTNRPSFTRASHRPAAVHRTLPKSAPPQPLPPRHLPENSISGQRPAPFSPRQSNPVSTAASAAETLILFGPCCEITTYLRNNCIASSANTPPVIAIGTNGAFAAISALEIMI
jgi:hypothetical protein